MRHSAGFVVVAAMTVAAASLVRYYCRCNDQAKEAPPRTERKLTDESSPIDPTDPVETPEATPEPTFHSSTSETHRTTKNNQCVWRRVCDDTATEAAARQNIQIKARVDFPTKAHGGSSTLSYGKKQAACVQDIVKSRVLLPKEQLSEVSKAEIEWLAAVDESTCFVIAEDEPTVSCSTVAEDIPGTLEVPTKWRRMKQQARSLRSKLGKKCSVRRGGPKQRLQDATMQHDASEFYV